jgi:hypothetical protein
LEKHLDRMPVEGTPKDIDAKVYFEEDAMTI